MDELRREVEKQARTAVFNRRVARGAENGERECVSRGSTDTDFFCTCGRPDCDEIISMPIAEHAFIRERPYRFLVASGHATDADDVILRMDEYDVVEVKPEYRDIAARIVTDGLAGKAPTQDRDSGDQPA